jgi:ELWxxDGT repeat protein
MLDTVTGRSKAINSRTDARTLTVVGDVLFFSAEGDNNGQELWMHDTRNGITQRVSDIAPGRGDADPTYLNVIDDRLYFSANDGSRGAELWALELAGLAQPARVAVSSIGGADQIVSSQPTDSLVIGTAEARRAVEIYFGSSLLGSVQASRKGTFLYTLTEANLATIGQGETKAIRVRQTDAAGTTSRSAAFSFSLDTTPPSVVSFTPLDGAVGFDPAANISLLLSESIQRGSGTIQLRTGSATGPITESFAAATSSRLSIRGNGLTINPSRVLAPNTRYFLTLPAGSISDSAGNPFAGTSTYDFRTANAVYGTPANDIHPFSSSVDRLTGLAGSDRFRLTSLSHALLPPAPSTPLDRITDLVTGVDSIDAPVSRTIGRAVNPIGLGAVAELSAAAIGALLTPARFPALTTTSSGGAASFTFNDPVAGSRTFLAINDGEAGYSAARDSILEITGVSGNLNELQVF